MDSSVGIGTNYQPNHQPGAQNEPFFDLLQPTVSFPSTFSQNPTQNSTKMENNAGDIDFGGGDNVLPSFDFQSIRSSGVPPLKTSNPAAGRMEESRSRQASPPPSYTPYEPMVRRSREPPPTYEAPLSRSPELEKESFETATVAAVERTMKKYADNLLRVLEGLTGRLSQLESSTQRLEHLYGEIRNALVNNHGEVDGKLRSLENHILEVQRGVQLLRDRQELAEAQSQLAKLQAGSKSEVAAHSSAPSAPPPVAEQIPELSRPSSGKAILEGPQQPISNATSSSHYQQLQLPSIPSHSPPQSLPPQQPQGPQQQQQQQVPPLQQPSEVSHQSLHQQPPPPPPPSQQMTHPQQHPPPPPPPLPGQMSMQPFYNQQQQPPPQPMSAYGHPPEGPVYNQHPQGPHHVPPPPQSYSPDLPSYHPSSYGPPGPLPQPQRSSSQILPTSHIQAQHSMYDPSITRSGSGQLALPPPYLPQGQQVSSSSIYDPQSPGSGYPSSSYRVAQPVPSAPSGGGGGGGGGYPRLPVAHPLPQTLPPGGSGGGPPGTPPISTNRVPIDEVIEKVTQMGFSKDQVRAVVRRLTENGQSVDLNIVLDKLMNGGDAQPPPKGWFSR